MSGAILNVVYGIPLCNKFGEEIRMSEALKEALENEDNGFLRFYSAYDESPAAFGVEVSTLYEGGICEVGELRLTATIKEFAEFEKLWNFLPEELQIELSKLGAARVFFLWSSS